MLDVQPLSVKSPSEIVDSPVLLWKKRDH